MPRDSKAPAVPQTVEELLATPTWLRLWLLGKQADEVVGTVDAKHCVIARFLRQTAGVQAWVGCGEVAYDVFAVPLPDWAGHVVARHDHVANGGAVTAVMGLAILDWCAP